MLPTSSFSVIDFFRRGPDDIRDPFTSLCDCGAFKMSLVYIFTVLVFAL